MYACCQNGSLRLAEQVVQQRGDRVRDGVRIQIVVQRVVADAGVQADLEVVVCTARAGQHAAHLAAEVAFHLQRPGRRFSALRSCARQRSSWSTYGYMHADVLPVPTAPRIMTPVYRPRCGIVSHVGSGARPGACVKVCLAEHERYGAGRFSGFGYRGNGAPEALARVDRQRWSGPTARAKRQGTRC